MANIFENAANWFAQKVASYIQDARSGGYSILGNYYSGDHRPQLKRRVGQPDDNIVQNYVGLAVDRSVSRLFCGGVEFNLPEGAEAQQEYIARTWDLNKQEILLYQLGLHGAVYGTPFLKISPDVLEDPFTGEWYPRLIAVDPEIIRVKTDPQDMNEVEEYRIEYKTQQKNEYGTLVREMAYREITRRAGLADLEGPDSPTEQALTWIVESWEQAGGGPWQQVGAVNWPYSFPPIVHWKNLPSLKSCYGDSDIDDAINVQDKSNFVVSNIGKIIKYHAHPETIGTGFSVDKMQKLESSVGSFRSIPNENAKVFNLEMASDLASSQSFALNMRQSIFDIAREIDITSMADKLGALTNFGLRVLFSDAIDKNNTKRELYGDALREINRRLLVLGGYEGEASDPGEIHWGEALPVNVLEELEADQLALELGIVDKATVAARYEDRYGVSWDDVQAALEEEQTQANAQNADVGAMILRNFNQGKGTEQPQEAGQGIMPGKKPVNAA